MRTVRSMNRVLYRFALSGHCHRVELFLSLLDLPVQLVDVDLVAGEHKQPQFLSKNLLGQVPVLQDGECTLPDSNAILVYLARRYAAEGHWLPQAPAAQAAVQRWLSIAAGPLHAGPALARAAAVFKPEIDTEPARDIGRQLFGKLDEHLAARSFLATEHATLADIALYSYTAHAPEGGISLVPFEHVRRWLSRIEALPRFVPMAATATAALAQAR
jgi:glutathione S-transferase